MHFQFKPIKLIRSKFNFQNLGYGEKFQIFEFKFGVHK